MDTTTIEHIIQALQKGYPTLQAIYLFGSFAQGVADAQSDIDLAILVDGQLNGYSLWQQAQQLAMVCQREVDLVDLRKASTVLQYQIITTGTKLWQADTQMAVYYELFILKEKLYFDALRQPLLDDIAKRGYIYAK